MSSLRSSSFLYKIRCNSYIKTTPIIFNRIINYRENHENHQRKNTNSTTWKIIGFSVGIASLSYGFYSYFGKQNLNVFDSPKQKQQKLINDDEQKLEKSRMLHKTVRTDLPTILMSDIAKHDSLEKSVWITYGIGVYDITKFIPEHPGSDKVMLAAGGAIDPFWHIFQQHNTIEILELLETFRIGNLNADEQISTKDLENPWSDEPKRHPILKAASKQPYNAEPPLTILTDSFITPNEFFYIRNHLPVPNIDAASYELDIEIEGTNKVKTLKLENIKKYPKHTITAAIMCGGNRRSEMTEHKTVKGLSWGAAAVGNAKWSGALLSDVLKDIGFDKNTDDNWHIQFEGLDTDPTFTPYGGSITLTKGMDPKGDVLLAYEMNGEPLTRDRGYPLRVIAPGVVGARNVKWLGKIIISKSESNSHWQQNDYKGFSPSTDWDTVDFSKSPAIQNMPVTSAICNPISGDTVKVINGFVTVKGYAWSGGGNRIVRVDVTGDGGNSWYTAELDQEDLEKSPPGRHWGWTIWTAKIPVKNNIKNMEIWAKAVDSNYNCQPESFKNIWNLRGVLSNAYHRVKINLQK